MSEPTSPTTGSSGGRNDPELPELPHLTGADAGQTSFSARLKAPGPDPIRLGLVAGVALIVVIGVGLTVAATPSPSTSGAAPAASAAPGTNQPTGPYGFGFRFGPRSGGGFGAFGGPGGGWTAPDDKGFGRGGRGFGPGFHQITITGVNGSSISLKTDDGWTRTITVTASTAITKGGQKAALTDLKVGDQIRFRETRGADGSFTIDEIDVVLPHVEGSVTGVSGSGFTIKARDGTTWTISVTGSTVYTVGPGSGSNSDVTVGTDVAVEGAKSGDASLTATTVRVRLPVVAGRVTAKTDSTITLQRPDGTTATIHVGTATTYQVRGVTNAGIGDIAVGMLVAAQGRQRADGSLDGVAVFAVNQGGTFRGKGPGWGGPAAPGASASPGIQG